MAQKITHYDVGDVWVAQATFTVSGTPTDPTTLTVRQQDAAGTETILANGVNPASLNASSTPVAKTSTGVFKLNPGIALTAPGYWFVKFEGTGAAAATETQQAIVDPDEFGTDLGVDPRALVGLAETKDWLQQQNIDTSNDLELVRVINDVSARFHDEAGREFKVVGTNPQLRLFDVDQEAVKFGVIQVGDMAAAPTLVRVINSDWQTVVGTVASTDIIAEPVNRDGWTPIQQLVIRPFTHWLWAGMRVEVTGNYGFPAVPGSVRQAVLDEVAVVMDRDVEHYRQDQAPVTSGGEATNVIVIGSRPQLLPLSARTLAVARSYRDVAVA